MCELMTIAAAVVFTALYFRCRGGALSKSLFDTMLIFWGAATMWSVDCVFGLFEAEPGTPFLAALFDLSAKDALLGAIIVACGLSFFAFSVWRNLGKSVITH